MIKKGKAAARNKAFTVAAIMVCLMAIVLISTASAGTNSWKAANTDLSNRSVKSLAISPLYTTDKTIFAGTGGGIFRSTNGGQDWSSTGLTAGTVRTLALSPNFGTPDAPTVAFAGTESGVFESTDTGATWNESIITSGGVNSFAVSPKLELGKD